MVALRSATTTSVAAITGVAAIASSAARTANANGTLTSNNIINSGNEQGLSLPGRWHPPAERHRCDHDGRRQRLTSKRIVGNPGGAEQHHDRRGGRHLELGGGATPGPNTAQAATRRSGHRDLQPLARAHRHWPRAHPRRGGRDGCRDRRPDHRTPTARDLHAAAPFFPIRTPIAFTATGGPIAPTSEPTASGMALSTCTATTAGSGTA